MNERPTNTPPRAHVRYHPCAASPSCPRPLSQSLFLHGPRPAQPSVLVTHPAHRAGKHHPQRSVYCAARAVPSQVHYLPAWWLCQGV
jgi:hypothetical protein